MAKFKIGEKVVCINDTPGWISKKKLLNKNDIYEIIRVSEMNGDIMIEGISGFWDSSRFRPLIDNWVEDILNEVLLEVNDNKILIKL